MTLPTALWQAAGPQQHYSALSCSIQSPERVMRGPKPWTHHAREAYHQGSLGFQLSAVRHETCFCWGRRVCSETRELAVPHAIRNIWHGKVYNALVLTWLSCGYQVCPRAAAGSGSSGMHSSDCWVGSTPYLVTIWDRNDSETGSFSALLYLTEHSPSVLFLHVFSQMMVCVLLLEGIFLLLLDISQLLFVSNPFVLEAPSASLWTEGNNLVIWVWTLDMWNMDSVSMNSLPW